MTALPAPAPESLRTSPPSLRYHRLLRALPAYRWWKPLVALVLAAVFWIVFQTIVTLVLLVVALDLTSVTGGLHPPALVIPWWTLAVPIALGLVARVALALAAVPHRAERLGLLMRAG